VHTDHFILGECITAIEMRRPEDRSDVHFQAKLFEGFPAHRCRKLSPCSKPIGDTLHCPAATSLAAERCSTRYLPSVWRQISAPTMARIGLQPSEFLGIQYCLAPNSPATVLQLTSIDRHPAMDECPFWHLEEEVVSPDVPGCSSCREMGCL